MSSIRDALYESLHYEEDFQEEILDSLEETGSLQEDVTAWDKLVKQLPELEEDVNSLKEAISLKEDASFGQALDSFYKLIIDDVPPAEAKSRVLQDMGIHESLTEEVEKAEEQPLSREERMAKRKSDYMKEVCEEFRKSANFFLDEDLDEDKIKHEEWRIKNLAVRKGIPSADIREALLKGNKE